MSMKLFVYSPRGGYTEFSRGINIQALTDKVADYERQHGVSAEWWNKPVGGGYYPKDQIFARVGDVWFGCASGDVAMGGKIQVFFESKWYGETIDASWLFAGGWIMPLLSVIAEQEVGQKIANFYPPHPSMTRGWDDETRWLIAETPGYWVIAYFPYEVFHK